MASLKKRKPAPTEKGVVRMPSIGRAARDRELAPKTVTQSNDLISAAYSLTLNEKRLLLMAAAQLDPRKPPKRNVSIRVSATEFAETFAIKSRGHAYEALEDAAVRLYERSIRSVERNKRGIPVEERRWLTGRAVYEGGMVMLEFNEGVLPYMTLLNEQFTSYQLQQVAHLSSFYAIRLYELAAQYKRVGERTISLEKLRETLDLGDKYPSVQDLRRYIIDPAMAEISETSDLKVAAEPVREGRRIVGFRLTIDTNHQQRLPLK